MTGTRRTQVLRAAVEVLGRGGSRALSHGAVDAAAGVAAGTASNYFRTRDALVRGVLEYVLAAESARYATAGIDRDVPVGDPAERVVQEAGAMLRHLAGPGRSTALARQVISLEAAWRPELRGELARGRQLWWRIVVDLLAASGVVDPERYTRPFLSCLDGLLLDQLRQPDPEFDPEPVIRALLSGLRAAGALER